MPDPLGHCRAIDLDAFAGEDAGLAIERDPIAVFRDRDVGQQSRPWAAFLDWQRRRGSLKDLLAQAAGIFRADVLDHLQPRRDLLLARFWCYAVDPRPHQGTGHPAVLYRYSVDRKGERPRSHLESFSGYLQADAFPGYEALYRPDGNKPPRITHAACMAHARRKFFEVFEATKSPIAEQALRQIQPLYAIEADINGKPSDQRRAVRQQRSKPLLETFQIWAKDQRRRISGKTPLGKALQYSLTRWDALARYIDDGRLSIDNNLAERLLRGIAVSRKNFLFLGSDRGGERAAIIYTIVETAKLNGLDPETYLATVLDRLAHGHLNSKRRDGHRLAAGVSF